MERAPTTPHPLPAGSDGRPGEGPAEPVGERRLFGPTGVLVPTIGQGTWQLRDAAGARETLREGIRLGMTHIDTAELYRGSEEVIREAVAGVPRQSLFVVSKVLPAHGTYKGVLAACDASLARLGTDHVDVYLVHWWEDDLPLEETMRAMAELADRGRVRSVGVSNFTAEQMERAQSALGRKHRLACDQVLYNLSDRSVETEIVPYCAKKGIAVVGYSPRGTRPGMFPRPGTPGRAVLDAAAAKHGRTTQQVVLRYLTRQEHVFGIPKAERVAHVRENAGACGWSLDEEDVERISAAFPLPADGGRYVTDRW